MKRLLIILFLFGWSSVFGQGVAGVVMNAEGKVPVEFVNVGIVGKNVGTVSDVNGRFSFFVDPKYDNDTVIFSIIGYKPQLIKVSALKKGGDNLVLLEERAYEMNEVIVRLRIFKQRTLGVTTKFKRISAGFKDNILGYECGILMNVKKSAFLKKVNINISNCSLELIIKIFKHFVSKQFNF